MLWGQLDGNWELDSADAIQLVVSWVSPAGQAKDRPHKLVPEGPNAALRLCHARQGPSSSLFPSPCVCLLWPAANEGLALKLGSSSGGRQTTIELI
jgi:hypothetical protein